MNLVTHTEQVRRHARVPAACVVTKVNTSFKQLAECEIGHRHRA
ncbi:30S ribosomal protein S2 [Acetobacter orientalis]|uniref:30S ribosomal protein S2 n=1 Tax=Acetobacter orientalis TaxID=146474 RepID=A0A2Z5ZL77_9PROT|nr:30S ribosomal protein S2 [Acetobacter orientalis]